MGVARCSDVNILKNAIQLQSNCEDLYKRNIIHILNDLLNIDFEFIVQMVTTCIKYICTPINRHPDYQLHTTPTLLITKTRSIKQFILFILSGKYF